MKILFCGARYIYTCTTPDLVVELLLGCPTWYLYREINDSETLISVMLKLGGKYAYGDVDHVWLFHKFDV